MRKDWISYVGTMVLLFGAIALFGSDLSMVIGAAIFAVSMVGMPIGAIVIPAILCIGIFAFMTESFTMGLLISLGFIVPGIMIGIMIRKKASLSMIIGSATFARFLLLGLYYYELSIMGSTTVKALLTGGVASGFSESFAELGYGEETLAYLERFIEFTGEIIPAVIMISSLGFVILTILVTKFMLRKMPALFSGIRRLRDIKMDISFTLGAILLFILMFFTEGKALPILMNLNYLMYVIYMYAGFAFIFRNIKKAVPSTPVSVLLTLIAGVVSFGILYVIAGIIGSFIPKKEEKVPQRKEQN